MRSGLDKGGGKPGIRLYVEGNMVELAKRACECFGYAVAPLGEWFFI